jgi:hypothetical protein
MQSAMTTGTLPSSLPSTLNLSSTHKTYVVPSTVGTQQIMIGGHQTTVNGGSVITPAEAVALQQVLATGVQSIVLGANGTASGGSFILPAGEHLATLTVPHGVTAVDNFAGSSLLSLSGNLTNAGSFYAVSTSPSTQNAVLSAANITNSSGGLITSVLPANTSFIGLSGLSKSLDLSLLAMQTLTNAGTISSSGNLNLVAGQKLVNLSSSGTASLAAANDINLATPQLVKFLFRQRLTSPTAD